MCFDHSTIIIRHPLCKLTRSSHSNVPQPQPTLKAKIDERSQRKRDIEGYWRHLETLDMFSCWSFAPIHSRHSWELKFDEKKTLTHIQIHVHSRQLLILNSYPCPTSNVDPTCDGRTQRRSVSLYSSSPWNSSHTLCKNPWWKFGDHFRPPSTRPPSSCRTPSASSTPWPHGSAPLFWSLSNPPPPPSQLIFLTRILHCLSFKKVCFSTYSLATPMSLRCRGSH